MNTLDLVIEGKVVRRISLSEEIHTQIEKATADTALIGRVESEDELATAVTGLQQIATVLKAIEESRKAVKEPFWQLCCSIDEMAKKLKADLKPEELRVNKLIGDYETAKLARARAAEAAQRETIAQIERDREAKLAEAQTHEAREKIQAQFCQAVQDLPSVKPERTVKGLTVRPDDWRFEVTDIWTLARAHPSCVTITPRNSEITALLKAGVKVSGIKAWQEVSVSTRTKPVSKALEIA